MLMLEDYDKGTLAPSMIPLLVDRARSRRIPVVVDPKYRHFFSFAAATVFKPNRRELAWRLGAPIDSLPRPYRAALDSGRTPRISCSRWAPTEWCW